MSALQNAGHVRLHVSITGAVQGVGFRPFVYRLASELAVQGWVGNTATGVLVEVEGSREILDLFLSRLASEKPPRSMIQALDCSWLAPVGYAGFEIRESERLGSKTAVVLPDVATCPDCLEDIVTPGNRRFAYPFANCTNCGPRFTIIEALPYDRPNTSMRGFVMCPVCRQEYENPRDRRFHAQPNACPDCGPHLEWWDPTGRTLSVRQPALEAAAQAIRAGAIVAVKGLGGFHLMTAAHSDVSVRRLRERKRREEKPFALMFPGLAQVRDQCQVSDLEESLLCSPAAPIVLLRRKPAGDGAASRISPEAAPGNPYLGVLLPSTPQHHLLMRLLGFPVVATSGNLAEEPLCIDEHEAVERLGGVVDGFLVHNRPIVRHADDSIVRVMAGRELILRRARGFAPLPVMLPGTSVGTEITKPIPAILAVGGHLKNTIALAIGRQTFLSQHIGDLETTRAYAVFERVIGDFQHFYDAKPALVAADAHPDYLSTKFAKQTGLSLVLVQHHYAHILACMAELGLEQGDVLGVSWDGTGYGTDGTIWGGEFLTLTPSSFERFGHLRTFPLPGGEIAVREPRRAALGLLFEMFGEAVFEQIQWEPVRAFSRAELPVLRRMLVQKLNCPRTSSVGRLFDAVSSLLGLRQRSAFEGQAAMELEWAIDGVDPSALPPPEPVELPILNPLPTAPVSSGRAKVLDWEPLVRSLLQDLQNGLPPGHLSMTLHNSLAEAIIQLAQLAAKKNVVLSGGCFQNKYLTERVVARLHETGFCPFWHRSVPPNDGGIALGQVLATRRQRLNET
jgi:hydrogenase maturation protein HypF